MILFLLEDGFSPVDLITNFLPEAEEMVIVQIFFELVHTRSEFAMKLLLSLDDLSFLRRSFLAPDLSS